MNEIFHYLAEQDKKKSWRPKGWENPYGKQGDLVWGNSVLVFEAGADAMLKVFSELDMVEILEILAKCFPDRYTKVEENDG